MKKDVSLFVCLFVSLHSSKECQMTHWQHHKAFCQKVRQDSCCNIQLIESLKDDSERHDSPLPLYQQTLPLQDTLKIDRTNKQGGCCKHPASTESISLKKTECGKHQERNSENNQPLKKKADFCPPSSESQQSDHDQKVHIQDSVTIVIKHRKARHELCIPRGINGEATLQLICTAICIPVSKLKLIHKGKMATSDNIQSMLFNKSLFLAFGEVSESEEGLEKADIDLIVNQLNVERNLVVRVLRKTGNVLDAMLEIGNL